MSKESTVTNSTFVRDVFEYLRHHHPSANPLRQRWIEVDLFDRKDKELQAGSPLDLATR